MPRCVLKFKMFQDIYIVLCTTTVITDAQLQLHAKLLEMKVVVKTYLGPAFFVNFIPFPAFRSVAD